MSAVRLIEKVDRVELLSSVVVPREYYDRIDLGVEILNEIFGGKDMPGILPGVSALLTGEPGAGKSTMALHLSDLMAKNSGRNVLYNLGEENRYMVKMRADRIGVTGGFCVHQIDEVDDLIRFCDDAGVEVLFQDSLQMLRDGDLSGPKLLKTVTKKLQAWKEKSKVTVFLVGHSTKSGRFAGPNEIKHDVDMHIHISIDKETGNRVLELEKNRAGPATIPYQFSMSSSGLDFQQSTHVDEDEAPLSMDPGVSRAHDRREKVTNLIKEKLLAGEKISGYCFERFDVDCSGGFWRGMLARAVKELTYEGHRVAEVRIDGRTHNFIEKK